MTLNTIVVMGQEKSLCKPVNTFHEMDKLKSNEEQILIRITGQDRPGLTAAAMEILARYNARILDIGQADIHSTLSLGILIRIDELHSGQVMKELLFKAEELNVNIGFSPISDDEYESWVDHQGKNRYILTVIGRTLSAKQIAAATKIIADQGLKHRLHSTHDRAHKHKTS